MEQKTELPTTKKKEDSAKKGQIFISRDLIGFLSLPGICAFVYFTFTGYDFNFYFDIFNSGFDKLSIQEYTRLVSLTALKIISSIVGVSLFFAVILTMIQTRFHLASEAIRFEFSNINPISGIKEIFSLRSLKDCIKSVFFLCMSLCGVYIFAIKYFRRILAIPYGDITNYIHTWRSLLPPLVVYMLTPILAVIALDALMEFFLYIKDLMMTKQEKKQEHKNNEGNPEIKGKRKEIHRELLSEQTKFDVRESRFVLANPTHIAIGIYYYRDFMEIPFISLVERNAKAIAVIKYAEEQGVPVIRNIPLARAIFKTAKPFNLVENDFVDNVMQLITWLEQVEDAGKMQDPYLDSNVTADIYDDNGDEKMR